MNIIILSNEHPQVNNMGGIATFNVFLAQSLATLGHTVTFLLPKKPKNTSVAHEDIVFADEIAHSNGVVRILHSQLFSFLARKLSLTQTLASLRISFSLYLALKEQLQIRPASIVHSELYYSPALFSSIMLHRKISFLSHSHGSIRDVSENMHFDTRVLFILELVQAFFSKKVISCSQSQLLRDSARYQTKKCITIPNPYTGKKYSPVPSRSNALLFFGRVEKRKGVEHLMNAFKKMKKKNASLRLYIIGNNDLKIQSNASLRILPRIDDKNALYTMIRKINPIVILPAPYEPFGYTILESLSLGCLTIASKYGGGSEMIQDGQNGFLCEPTIQGIIDVFQKVSAVSTKSALQIKKQAILTQERYTIQKIGKQYEKLYESL